MSFQNIDENKFRASKDCLYTKLQEESVILSLKNGKYYGLNAVGVSIWQKLQTPVTFSEIRGTIQQEYDVDETVCDKEVSAFLEHLKEEGLVDGIDEASE